MNAEMLTHEFGTAGRNRAGFILLAYGIIHFPAIVRSRAKHPRDCMFTPNSAHSYRKASAGSTLVARRAGAQQAARAAANSTAGTQAKVSGSAGFTWKSRL